MKLFFLNTLKQYSFVLCCFLFTASNVMSQAYCYINEVIVKPGTSSIGPQNQSLWYPGGSPFGSEGIELYNPSCAVLNISHWIIVFHGDNNQQYGVFRFPNGTSIPIGGFLTLGADGTSVNNVAPDVATSSDMILSSYSSTYFLHADVSRLYLDNNRGYVALYNESGVPMDCVYWHGTASGEGPGSWAESNSSQVWFTALGTGISNALIPPGDLGAPAVFSLPGPGSASLDAKKRCAGYLANAGVASAQNVGNGQPTIQRIENITYGSNNAGNAIIGCGTTCNATGNLIVYSNYDGGILTINVDQNIPNLKVGICTYEPIQVTFTGPFVGNITQVVYAGMNSNQNNNNCGLGNFPTSITGVPAAIVSINPPMNPPPVGYTPAHGNGSGPWGGGMLGVAGLCDTTVNAGGGNTPDEVVYYFLNATGGTLLFHQTQYACWLNETLNVTAAGNCCILPPVSNPCPTISVSNTSQTNVLCFGNTTGAATVNATGGSAAYTYTWSPGNLIGASQSNLAAGTYTINVVDGNNCPGSATAIITQPSSALSVSISSNPTNCGTSTGTATATPSGGTGSYTYSWSPSGGSSAVANNLGFGPYIVAVTDANLCQVTGNVTITTIGGPTVTLQSSTDVTCFNGANGTAAVSVTGGTGAYTYLWTPSGGVAASASNLTAGNYTATVTDAAGCSSSLSVIIGGPTQILINETVTDIICGSTDGQITTSVSGGSGTYTYAWTPNGETSSSITNLSAGTYGLTVTDSDGCSMTESYIVAITGSLTILATPVSTIIQQGQSVQLSAAGGTAYTWIPSNGLSCTDCANPIATPSLTTIYTVTGTDASGCAGSADVTIVVQVICGEVFVPTIFAPSDGGAAANNKLCVFGNCIAELNYAVYNRWGEKVFETTNVDLNECWDGTYKDKPLNTGVFVYKLLVTLIDGTQVEESGNVTLIR